MEKVKHPNWKFLLVGVSTFVGTFLAVYLKIPFGFLIAVTSFVLLQLFLHELYLKAIERILGPAIISVLSVGLVFVFQEHWIGSALGCCAIVFFCMYYYAQKWHGYGMLLGGLTSALVVSFYYLVSPHDAIELAFYWPFDIMLGVLIMLPFLFLIRRLRLYRFHQDDATKIAFIAPFNKKSAWIAMRIVVTIALIIAVNGWLKQPGITVQGLIAGVVVSAQFDLALTHHRLFFRVMGVIIGCLIALGFGLIIEHLHMLHLEVILIPLALMMMTALAERCPAYMEYFFLQAGVMVPLILLNVSHGEIYSTVTGVHRALGSIEGGVIALLVVYLFHLACFRRCNGISLQDR